MHSETCSYSIRYFTPCIAVQGDTRIIEFNPGISVDPKDILYFYVTYDIKDHSILGSGNVAADPLNEIAYSCARTDIRADTGFRLKLQDPIELPERLWKIIGRRTTLYLNRFL